MARSGGGVGYSTGKSILRLATILGAAVVAGGAGPTTGGEAGVRAFVFSNLFFAGPQEPGACKVLSGGAPEAYVKTLPPAEQAKYAALDKRYALEAALAQHFGFRSLRLEQLSHDSYMKSAKLPADYKSGKPPTEEQVGEIAALNGFPPNRGRLAYLNHMIVYSACSNPDDFPMLAQGYRPYDGKLAVGMDLDRKQGESDYVSPTGERGVDNQVWRTMGCTKAFIENGDPKVAKSLLFSARAPTIIELRGLPRNNSLDAANVAVNIYASIDPVTRDGRGGALAWASYRLDPDRSLRATTHGQLVNGVLTTDPVDIKVNYKEQIIDAPRVIRGARIRMTIKPDGAVEGMIAGYYTLDSFYDSIEQMTQPGADVNGISCPGVHAAIRKFADGYPDPATGKNTAISSALSFFGVPAFVVADAALAGGGNQP